MEGREKAIRQIARANQGIADVLSRLALGGHYLVQGVSGSQRALLADLLIANSRAPVLFVSESLKDAMTLLSDYQFFSGRRGYLFPARPTLGTEVDAESPELEGQRAVALQQALRGPCLVAAPAAALLELLPPPEFIKANSLTLAPGGEMPLPDLTRQLAQMGYQRVDKVDGPGQFSQRGEILDLCLPGGESFRVEYFDLFIDSVRSLDLSTQRSRADLEAVNLGPARLLFLTEELRQRALERLAHRGQNLSPLFLPQLARDRERFAGLRAWPGAYHYLQYLFDRPGSLLDYFRGGAAIVGETARVFEGLDLMSQELLERHQSLLEGGKLIPDLQPWLTAETLAARWDTPTLHTALLARSVKHFRPSGTSSLAFRQAPKFYGQEHLIVDEVRAWLKREALVVVAGAGRQLSQALKAQDIPVREGKIDDLRRGNVNFVPGALSAGFELVEQGLVVLSFNELAVGKGRPKSPRPEKGMSARDLESLTPGEYVVHFSHGIGQFLGIVVREAAGAKRDYLYIKYAGKDRLYLPTDQVHLLQRYLGGGEKPPKLYALGGGDWQRVKAKVRESVQKMAFDLLQVYAARQAAPGHPFAPDSPWQRELEDSFPFQETRDQLRTIDEVKRDMEKPRPMDRLLCGDVGYGKTEVALRAAMKAVMDGKQVAILAPTTILAQQHFNTFRDRFASFPIRIEVLSRLKTPAEQKEIISAAAGGVVDILIGTHRLLQKDIRLPALGLLVVDEEQRFGVEHKERIKQVKTNVDILTMTATPIPRTLHMAMLGIRDLSVINTPPEGRFPVQTYVMELSDQLVVTAVRRELDRGGQVYIIFNRVQGIEAQASRLRRLLPEVSIGMVHGQMADTLLERTMLDFYEGRFQVLLSTTIIENGLDIPNVNTVIVHDADRLGLSQLYQLRGRVGRGRRLAYAYFTYRRDRALTEKSQKRLSAIKEFTELGAGYKLSLRDMEIRGTGNILGPEQHGYIAAVGFDLYCQLLEQQVRQLANEPVQEQGEPEVSIELPVDAFIPSGYLPEQEKIYVYRRIKDAKSPADIDDIQEELVDRFGSLPLPLAGLLQVGRARTLASALAIRSISWNAEQLTGEEKVVLTFLPGKGPPRDDLQRAWLRERGKFDFREANRILTVSLSTDKANVLAELVALLSNNENCH